MGLPNCVQAAVLTCSFGTAPGSLMPLPKGPPVLIEGKPAGTVDDMLPVANIPPFAMCSSLSNPTVAAATAAAMGVLTPMPCLPVPAGRWQPGAVRTMVNGSPALTAGSLLTCAWGGVVTVGFPGSVRTQSA